MREFRVVLQGRAGWSSRSVSPADANESGGSPWRGQLSAFSPFPTWYEPEAVQVRISRPFRSAPAPKDWELDLLQDSPPVGRAAMITVAAAGMLAAVVGTAQAAEVPAEVPATPPAAPSSTVRNFTPMDHPPRIVLVDSREVPASAAFQFSPATPLVDADGKPILIAAYHQNTATSHTNVPGNAHTNTPWSNHANSAATHANTAWSNHANFPGVHTNLIPGGYVF